MPDDRFNSLLKTEGNLDVEPEKVSKLFSDMKIEIGRICQSLNETVYNETKTLDAIKNYLQFQGKKTRILYSEINSFVFAIESSEDKDGRFSTNVEKLFLYALDEKNGVDEDCRRIVFKIYDHYQLILSQIDNAKSIFSLGIEKELKEEKLSLHKEIKGVEKEYVSILGIFAAIILAFVGGITFSSSVLQNIESVSIYRLLFVVDLLALVLVDVLYMLLKTVFVINEKDIKILPIKTINRWLAVFAILILIAWCFGAVECRNNKLEQSWQQTECIVKVERQITKQCDKAGASAPAFCVF